MSHLAAWLVAQAPAWLRGDHGRITLPQRRALLAITRCRTSELGGRVYRCAACAKHHYAYHSCHHRECPRCGGADVAEWARRQVEQLLPVPYFLWTFTVPEEMRTVFLQRPEVAYPLLFQPATNALQGVADRKNVLGADLGMIAVPHTWAVSCSITRTCT